VAAMRLTRERQVRLRSGDPAEVYRLTGLWAPKLGGSAVRSQAERPVKRWLPA
jgi:hypothetical protein